uniref:Uncharacterized protein n=1 Tax=Lactuca sativa TaxID=4236 RepID=A0A9R1UKA7_LACSA|nr:hypothetical protein LSAT_V11C900502620 [Lactuca sativa]
MLVLPLVGLIHDVGLQGYQVHLHGYSHLVCDPQYPNHKLEGNIEVINSKVLLTGSSSDEENDGKRRKTIRAIQRDYEYDATFVSEPFYIFKIFSSSKAQVKLHSIRTRKEIQL